MSVPARRQLKEHPSLRLTKRRKMSDSDSEHVSPHIPTSGVVKLYLVQAKLSAQNISELFSLAESHNLRVAKSGTGRGAKEEVTLELCPSPEQSDVVITNVHMRKRLERHIDWDLAKDKAIVTPEWLRDSVARRTILPCGDYAALRELYGTTVENCPDSDCEGEGGTEDTDRAVLSNDRAGFLAASESEGPVDELAKAHYTSRYACLRPCPMVCPNQDLVRQLGIIRRSRELEGKDTSALSYERAISVVKAYPYQLTDSRLAEVAKLPGIGDKMLSKITEYLESGQIEESQTIAASARFQALSAFTTVYGIGPTTARKLFDGFGLRTLADVAAHYADHPSSPPRAYRDGENASKIRVRAPTLGITAALALQAELEEKIPRAEVETMHNLVMVELAALRPGCLSTIVGGYRRGKAESNDVDIVITHPTLVSGSDQVRGLGELLVNRLYERGLVTHVMHLSSFRPPDALRTAHWDTLEKALTVFVLPPPAPRTHRRLDLIFAAPEAYWTAVTGWTGSKMFERDLRLYAKVERGLKFDSSGITRRRDSKAYFPRSEKEVFAILGLEWIEPEMRNADA
ncbi:DNA polymerase mu [Mycena galericulata]|nr:DNA polymerase mu [Mycena galericulata]